MEKYLIHPVLFFATLAIAQPPADHTVEIRAEQVGQPKPVHKDDYSRAYEAAQSCGKLCVYVGMDGCPHCPGARSAFRAAAIESGGACVELNASNSADRQYVESIQKEHGKGRGCPQVVVYQRFGDEWQIKCVIGNKPGEIRAVMTNLQAASVEKPCKCVSCSKSCRFGGNCACR